MSKITDLNGLAEFDIAQYIKTDADVAQYLCHPSSTVQRRIRVIRSMESTT